MARSILAAVERIKSELTRLAPEFIRQVCHRVGHVWRERVLDPVTTLHLFALQVLSGNTACPHVPRLGAVDCTGEAYGQARQRLPLAVFQRLLSAIRERLLGSPTLDEGRWHGHRTFLVDGSGVSMPDTPALQKEFGQPVRSEARLRLPRHAPVDDVPRRHRAVAPRRRRAVADARPVADRPHPSRSGGRRRRSRPVRGLVRRKLGISGRETEALGTSGNWCPAATLDLRLAAAWIERTLYLLATRSRLNVFHGNHLQRQRLRFT